MKIVIISFPFKHFFGGAERYVEELANALQREGHQVIIVTASWFLPFSKKRKSSHTVVSIHTFFYIQKYKHRIENFFNWRADSVLRSKKFNDVDLFIPQGVAAYYMLKNKQAYKAPIIDVTYKSPWRLYKQYESFIYHTSDKVVAITEMAKSQVMTTYNINAKDIDVLPTGVDIKKFRPFDSHVDIRKKYKIPENNKFVLTLQRMDGRKDLTNILFALQRIGSIFDAHCVVAGSGPDKERYRQFIHDQQLDKVHMSGFIDEEDLPLMYSEADVFISATWGQVVLEAMACGTATCLLDVEPACKEFVEDGVSGVLIEDDRESIIKTVATLLEDKKKRDSIANEGRRYIERQFNMDTIVRTFESYVR